MPPAQAVTPRSHTCPDDNSLVYALGLACYWQQLLDDSRFWSITQLAAAERLDAGPASSFPTLTHIPPIIVTAYISDSAAGLSLKTLFGRASLTWNDPLAEIPDRSP